MKEVGRLEVVGLSGGQYCELLRGRYCELLFAWRRLLERVAEGGVEGGWGTRKLCVGLPGMKPERFAHEAEECERVMRGLVVWVEDCGAKRPEQMRW